ncbi:hypothetical protein DI09_171p50 [Mitosporidium daphniae]|uniref:HECT-type E3 ubiquitin transferase n=1 Tax=Mitosporidium daphniae TaxID=1485682 RepID=A0A098VNN0_9MICR|nr:uncharacterized protein DI09_64p110 [Mitosporidium daphniae]XP_013238875.1 uncharacterized protein DI09_171p50 [Mitosporidium daphniae]KGG50575.1 hypothetical protein DI09_64p110 [Mitosporidium daphniae]KGG52439.1 hypothetical protein DI09_171p50 [Mitosporidium daphniae]|eukprot:XP_013237002.1 uncharacterized protein DI09_64p110 [Mitosporidium daphniae]
MYTSQFSVSIDKSLIPGTAEFTSALIAAHVSGDLEEGRSILFSGFSSSFVLGLAFSRRTQSDHDYKTIIDSESFNNFYFQLTEMKCSFFTQTLMASLDHLVRRPGVLNMEQEASPVRWILVALLTPFLSRKRLSMEGTFHHSLARRLFSLLRQACWKRKKDFQHKIELHAKSLKEIPKGKAHSEEKALKSTASSTSILNKILDALPLPLLRRLAELANWTLNVRIGRISSANCSSAKAKAKIIAGDWVILAGAYMLQMISESNGRVYRMEPSELYSMAIDLIPIEVILADWHQTTCSVSLKNLLASRGQLRLFGEKKMLLANHPGIISLGIKSRLLESELFPNGYASGYPIPLVVRIPRSPLREMLHASIIQLLNASPPQLRGRIKVEFQGEPGIDAGGLLREWLQLLIHALMDPTLGLFQADICGFELNAPCVWFHSGENCSQGVFELVHLLGTILGLSLNNGIVLDHRLPFALFKKLLSPDTNPPACVSAHGESMSSITLDDLWEIAPTLARGLGQLLDYHGEAEVEDVFQLQFTAGFSKPGPEKREIIDLTNRGSEIAVTGENREIFISLYLEHIFHHRPGNHWTKFRDSFYSTLSGSTIALLSPQELKQLLSGDPAEISIDLLRSVALYEGYLSAEHPVSLWFWDILTSYSAEMRRKFLIFVTGVGRLPAALAAAGAAGHSGMPNQQGPWVIRLWGRDASWKNLSGGEYRPLGRTCFNQLCLHKGYPDMETLRRLLTNAIVESEGFGIE